MGGAATEHLGRNIAFGVAGLVVEESIGGDFSSWLQCRDERAGWSDEDKPSRRAAIVLYQ